MTRATQRAGLIAAAVVAAPTVAAVGYIVAGAVGLAGAGAVGFSLHAIHQVLEDPAIWQGGVWTIGTAVVATALAALGATLVATAFRGHRLTDRAARALAVVPLPIPHLVAAAGAILVLGQSGLLARLAYGMGAIDGPTTAPALLYDRFGVGFTLALAWKEMPLLAVAAMAILSTRGTALDEVAQTLGAGPWHRLARVTLPVLWRGLFPVAAATFVFVAGSFEGAALLGPSNPLPLPVAMVERYADIDIARRPEAYVIALLLLLLGLGAIVVMTRAGGSDRLDESA